MSDSCYRDTLQCPCSAVLIGLTLAQLLPRSMDWMHVRKILAIIHADAQCLHA
jgi:hypothetical protein